MIVYNVTTKINWNIHKSWLSWMKEEHIPEVLATGMFYSFQILRLLDIDETEGPTYAVQYHANDLQHYKRYINEFASSLREKSLAKWNDSTISFRSIMEVVHHCG